MVHLGDGKLDAVPGFSAVGGDADALVVSHDHPVGIQGIDPHVVMVSAGRTEPLDVQSSIQCHMEPGGRKIHLVGIVRRHDTAGVIKRPVEKGPVMIDLLPGFTAVIRPPEALVSVFDERIHTVGIIGGYGHGDFSDFPVRQALSRQLLPCGPAVDRFMQASPRAAAPFPPGFDQHRPHPGKKDARVVGIHGDVGTPRVFVHEKHLFPGFAAIGGPENAPVFLWPVTVPHGSGQHDVRATRIDHDPADAARFFQTHALPGLSGIRRFIDPISMGDVAPDEGFPGSGPNDVGVRGGDRQRADGRDRLLVEYRLPVDAAVFGYENPPRSGPSITDIGIPGNPRYRTDPVSDRADMPVLELLEKLGFYLLIGRS